MENNVCAAAVIYVPYLHKKSTSPTGASAPMCATVEPSADAAYTFDEIKQEPPAAARRRTARAPLIAISRSHNTPKPSPTSRRSGVVIPTPK